MAPPLIMTFQLGFTLCTLTLLILAMLLLTCVLLPDITLAFVASVQIRREWH